MNTEIERDWEAIRAQQPLVHNITNYVVMNSTANALLAAGASPVMAHAIEEVEEMVRLSGALVINIGTLSRPWINAMRIARQAAAEAGIPVVLDPVGAGATRLRTETVRQFLAEAPPTVLRGNASEILALHEDREKTKGVDSRHQPAAARDAARALARHYGCVVCVSGEIDLILDQQRALHVMNGHPLMPRVTGLGCTASALTGAFLAVNRNSLEASANAMAVLGIAGEIAGEKAAGPGSLQMYLLDTLYQLDSATLRHRLRMTDAG